MERPVTERVLFGRKLPSVTAKDFPYETVGIPRSYPWDHGRVEVPVWTYNGHAVWGMTARLVRDIVSTL